MAFFAWAKMLDGQSYTSAPLAIMTNTASTRNRERGNWIDPHLEGRNDVLHVTFDDVKQIPDVLHQFAGWGVGTVAVNGGDGTAGLVFSHLINDQPYDVPPALALLPSGKTNMTAEAWSLTGDHALALEALLARHAANDLDTATNVQPLLAVQRADEDAPKFGTFFGTADVVRGINYARQKFYPLKMPNALAHAAAIGMLLGQAITGDKTGSGRTLDAQFDDGAVGQEDGSFFVVMATTLDSLILGLEPRTEPGEAPLRYLSVRPGFKSAVPLLPGLLKKKLGRSTKVEGSTSKRMNSVTLRFNGPYTIDGEMFEATKDVPVTVSTDHKLPFIRL